MLYIVSVWVLCVCVRSECVHMWEYAHQDQGMGKDGLPLVVPYRGYYNGRVPAS